MEIKVAYREFHNFLYKIYNVFLQLHSILDLSQPEIERLEEEYRTNLNVLVSSTNLFLGNYEIDAIINRLKENVQNEKKKTKKKIYLFLIIFVCLIIIFIPSNCPLSIFSIFLILGMECFCVCIFLPLVADVFDISLDGNELEIILKFSLTIAYVSLLITLVYFKIICL